MLSRVVTSDNRRFRGNAFGDSGEERQDGSADAGQKTLVDGRNLLEVPAG